MQDVEIGVGLWYGEVGRGSGAVHEGTGDDLGGVCLEGFESGGGRNVVR